MSISYVASPVHTSDVTFLQLRKGRQPSQAALVLGLGLWFHQSYCVHLLTFYTNLLIKAKCGSKKENTAGS